MNTTFITRALIPMLILSSSAAFLPPLSRTTRIPSPLYISSGFSFDDGTQILVSVQKPLGMVLEQDDDDSFITVAELQLNGAAAGAGVLAGDVLVAVQNRDVRNAPLEPVLDLIGQAPRVLNLRFVRPRE